MYITVWYQLPPLPGGVSWLWQAATDTKDEGDGEFELILFKSSWSPAFTVDPVLRPRANPHSQKDLPGIGDGWSWLSQAAATK